MTANPFCKGIYSKQKEFAHLVSKLFHFRVDPFSEGSQTELKNVVFLKVDQFPLSVI